MPPVIIRVKWLFFSVDHGDQRVYGIFKRDGIFKKDEAPNNHLTPKKGGFFSFCDVGTHLIVVYKTHLYSFFDRVMWIKLTALPRCINQERRIHQIQARCRSQAQNDYLNIILRLSFLIDTYQLKLFILITNHTIDSTFDFMKKILRLKLEDLYHIFKNCVSRSFIG